MNASAGGKPSITVTPHKELSNPIGDPQFVRISWSNISAGTLVYARQCDQHPTSVTKDCSQVADTNSNSPGLVTAGASGANGAGAVVFPVHEGQIEGNGGFNCDYKNPCTLAVFTDASATNLKTAIIAPIEFAFPASACPQPTGPSLQGSGAAGAFWPMLSWETTACRSPYNLGVQYTLKNSYDGMSDFASGASDFAVSGEALPPDQLQQLRDANRSFAYAPVSASSLVFGYRLFQVKGLEVGQQVTNLKLTPEILAKIFTGQITNWNDPAITALNPLPADQHYPNVVHAIGRADPSAWTYELTSWFRDTARSAFEAGGKDYSLAKGPLVRYPVGAVDVVVGAGAQVRGVAAPRQDTDRSQFGYIGYMDAAWAAKYSLPTVQVQNAAGKYVPATPQTVAEAIAIMKPDQNGVTAQPDFLKKDPNAYPMPSVYYMLVPQSTYSVSAKTAGSFDGADGKVLSAFLGYVLVKGQGQLPDGAVPLPKPLVDLGDKAMKGIPTSGSDQPHNNINPGGSDIPSGGGNLPTSSGTGTDLGTGSGIGTTTTGSTPGGDVSSGGDTPGGGGDSPSPTQPTAGLLPAGLLASAGSHLVFPMLLLLGLAALILGPALILAPGYVQRRSAAGKPAVPRPRIPRPKLPKIRHRSEKTGT